MILALKEERTNAVNMISTLRRSSPSASPLLDLVVRLPSMLLLMLLLFSIGWPSSGDRGGEQALSATPFLLKKYNKIKEKKNIKTNALGNEARATR